MIDADKLRRDTKLALSSASEAIFVLEKAVHMLHDAAAMLHETSSSLAESLSELAEYIAVDSARFPAHIGKAEPYDWTSDDHR
jgi:hypothetical protein